MGQHHLIEYFENPHPSLAAVALVPPIPVSQENCDSQTPRQASNMNLGAPNVGNDGKIEMHAAEQAFDVLSSYGHQPARTEVNQGNFLNQCGLTPKGNAGRPNVDQQSSENLIVSANSKRSSDQRKPHSPGDDGFESDEGVFSPPKRCRKGIISDESSDESSPCSRESKKSTRGIGAHVNDSDSDLLSDEEAEAAPLVNRSKLGESRRKSRTSEIAVSDLNLKSFFKERPLCAAVLTSYKKLKRLTEDDRRTLCGALVTWLLQETDYRPGQTHYRILTEKIVTLFPTEAPSMWFSPPRSEGKKQKGSKGKLPDRARNAKSKLRRKGLLAPVSRVAKEIPKQVSVPLGEEEVAAKSWLMRNNGPFPDVQTNWATCRAPRLKELFLNSNLTVAQYSRNWNDVLKLPNGYQLILDDFNALPQLFPTKYGAFEGKGKEMLNNWTNFCKKLLENFRYCGMNSKQVKAKQIEFDACPNENSKDLFILGLLSALCKLKCSVKVGNKVLKPSAVESKDALMMCVSGASELQNGIRERREKYAKLKASVQPYLAFITQEDLDVDASYVIVDDICWKASSVSHALDICFKTHFSLNCEYAAEANHLWLLLQKAVYGIQLDEDKNFASVTDLLGKLG